MFSVLIHFRRNSSNIFRVYVPVPIHVKLEQFADGLFSICLATILTS